MFGGPVDGIEVIVAIVKEVAHLFPGAGAQRGVLAAQRLVQRGQPFMGLPIGAVQIQKGARQRGRVRGGQPQIGQRRRGLGKHRVGQRLAHVRHQPFAFARGQFGHVQPEFLRQRQHHRRRNRAVVVLHLVQIGQRHAQLVGKDLLRQRQPAAQFAQLGPGIELLGGHGAPFAKPYTGFANRRVKRATAPAVGRGGSPQGCTAPTPTDEASISRISGISVDPGLQQAPPPAPPAPRRRRS